MNILNEFHFDDLYIRHAIDFFPDDKVFTVHFHDIYEIYYFISGNAKYLVEGTEYSLEPGSIMIMRPSESHKVKILESVCYERYALNFPVSAVEHIDFQHKLLKPFMDRPLGYGNLYTPSELENIPLESIFHEMAYCDEDDYGKRTEILTTLFYLLNKINKAYQKRNKEDYNSPQSIPEKIVFYVNEHLTDNISIPVLSEHFYLSSSQFSRIFKQTTGIAPWKYITIKRLNLAKEKIRSGIAAKNACETCGFSDYSAFYRAYTKYFGYSPQDTN